MPKFVVKNHEIAQLRAQLQKERKSSAALRQAIIAQKVTLDNTLDQLKVTEEALIRAKSTSPFQKKLPPEIRITIYKLLLVNRKLSEVGSIGKACNHGKSLKFELTPAILRTCKAIRNEAEPILYGSNIFIMECMGGCGPKGFSHVPQSPLTRYTDPDFELEYLNAENEKEFLGTEIHFDYNTLKALEKVKHWRIITSAYAPTPSNPVPAKSFVHFCQALCQQAPTEPQRSIDIVLALARLPATPINPKTGESQYEFSEKQLNFLLQPLRLLRDIKLVINIAQSKAELLVSEQACGILPDYYLPYNLPYMDAPKVRAKLERFMNLGPNIVQKYCALAEDLSPIEKVFKMHKRLEDYAVCFERSERFNEDMFTLQRGCEASFPVTEVRHYGWHLPRPSPGNPFKGLTHASYHPVEFEFSSKFKILCLMTVLIVPIH